MKKIVFLYIIIFSYQSHADDYKTAQRFAVGDVVSADVLNDILDRIELSLVTPVSSDLLGTWSLIQTTTANGCLGNGNGCSPSGYGAAVDSIYKQRFDTVTFKDDGDGTYSFQTTNYCAFIQGEGNTACNLSYAVIDGRMLLSNDGANYAYVLRKVSPTRFVISSYATGSQSYVSIRLDKQALPPAAPNSLAASVSSGSIALTWTAGDATEENYDIQRKSSSTGNYVSIGLPTFESFDDTNVITANTYWYRVFAKNINGTSIGSNVISVVAQ